MRGAADLLPTEYRPQRRTRRRAGRETAADDLLHATPQGRALARSAEPAAASRDERIAHD